MKKDKKEILDSCSTKEEVYYITDYEATIDTLNKEANDSLLLGLVYASLVMLLLSFNFKEFALINTGTSIASFISGVSKKLDVYKESAAYEGFKKGQKVIKQ